MITIQYRTGEVSKTFARKNKKSKPVVVETEVIATHTYPQLEQVSIRGGLVFINNYAYSIHSIVSVDNPVVQGLIGALVS